MFVHFMIVWMELDFFYTLVIPLYCWEHVHSSDFCTIALEMASNPKYQ